MIIAEKPKIEMHTAEEWKKIQQQRDEIYKQKIELYPQTLLEKINEYNEIYSKEFREYLEALVNLDIDILKDNTYSKEQLELLKQNLLFRKIINYNALTVSKNLLSNIDDKIIVVGNCLLGDLYAKDENGKLFDMRFLSEFPEYRKEISIAFFENEDEPERRKNKIEELYKKFDEEDKLKNPYDPRECRQPRKRKIGGPRIPVIYPHDEWEKEHQSRLEEYDRQLRNLESTEDLTKEQKNSNKLSKKIYKVFEDTYGPFDDSNEIERKNHEDIGIKLVKSNNNVKFIKKIKYYY